MIKKLFPLCMVHPINLRTFGQAGLLQLYQTARVNDLSHIISAYSIIDSFQLFYSNNQYATFIYSCFAPENLTLI